VHCEEHEKDGACLLSYYTGKIEENLEGIECVVIWKERFLNIWLKIGVFLNIFHEFMRNWHFVIGKCLQNRVKSYIEGQSYLYMTKHLHISSNIRKIKDLLLTFDFALHTFKISKYIISLNSPFAVLLRRHTRSMRHNRRQMLSLFILAASLFSRLELHVPWPSLFVLAVTICYRNWVVNQPKWTITTFAFRYVYYFLYVRRAPCNLLTLFMAPNISYSVFIINFCAC